MLEKIQTTEKNFKSDLSEVGDLNHLEELRIKYLGRKGLFAILFDEFKQLPNEEKPKYGQTLNRLKIQCQNEFNEIKSKFSETAEDDDKGIDLTLPGRSVNIGTKHILMQTLFQIKSIFKGLGFSVYEGPELESDYNNFEALNFPADHPARDMQDTFFVNENFLFRTHTSPVQVRLMKEKKPPIRAIIPGKVYRNEAISAKSYCLFHQVEGLYIDGNVSFAELKGTLVAFAKQFFGNDVKYRFRPSFFPFTEPSAEVDIWWQPKGKEGRWLEILGCGMVDPNVLENVGIDSEKYTGYAFGMGAERIAMLKYGIGDIRVFFDNDKRFLTQF
ncbi:MAG: phenylalanine--tRNA ligase subunit alpha [Bacteroidetes bacterium]|nr:phenylalanine--tRNA ligase subunit alpha [Bacteroidota bacterium]MBU1680053.1 phenylalanine--tRNA ligase subunit alpha [Bacteroidota bacterium]MBU2505390.1 phenylalanine--tRNA ligase subunit alpha [Bacteroidota bacterium]